MIHIKKGGIRRICSEKQFHDRFKAQGYKIIEVATEEVEAEQEIISEELTKKEICKLLDEKGLEYDSRQRKAELLELLGVE